MRILKIYLQVFEHLMKLIIYYQRPLTKENLNQKEEIEYTFSTHNAVELQMYHMSEGQGKK